MSNPVILVVDDEPDVVELIRRSLDDEGFDVLYAYDGLSALDLAEREQPDLILLDLMMPMMSGYEVAEQLKDNPLTAAVPVVCLTSADSLTARARAREAGAVGLIMKPFAPSELVQQLRAMLEAHRGQHPEGD
jgi:DNA-binding response OmpR family regulator